MNNPAGYAQLGTQNVQVSNAGLQQKRTGSLADACSMLNDEVSALEGVLKTHFERTTPFLEQARPIEAKNQTDPPRAPASPLAGSIFEYVDRLRSIRLGIQEISERISY